VLEWVSKDSKTCLTCRSIWERTGEYLIAEKSVEYVDDNLFMEIIRADEATQYGRRWLHGLMNGHKQMA
jgi:hypothetical protein